MTNEQLRELAELQSKLVSASVVMGGLPENPGYNGSVLLIDDIEAAAIEKDIDGASSAILALLDRIKELEDESQEQCRIIGMGSERELKLMAQLAAVEKDRAERGGVPDSQKLPFGYRMIAVKNFDGLLIALDRAESKGYMPDAILGEWEAFEYSQVPEPVQGTGDCAVCVLGIGGACYCGKAAPQPQPVQREPLTDEQISAIHRSIEHGVNGVAFGVAVARAVEAAHGVTKKG